MSIPTNLIDQILCGDSAVVLAEIPDESIDLVVTSPPYDDIRDYHGYTFAFEAIAQQLYRVMKVGGVVVWVVGDGTDDGEETGTSFRQALYFKEIGFKLHDTMIYLKNSFSRPATNRCHQVFEYMFVLSKGTPKTFHVIKDRKILSTHSGRASIRQKDGSLKHSGENLHRTEEFAGRFNVWQYKTGHSHSSEDKFAEAHPAIFPEALARDHIITWSNEGDVILDPFIGSGTTAKMAHLLQRHYIGIDISPDYCKMAKKRVSQQSLMDF